jgi:hypothetical protein
VSGVIQRIDDAGLIREEWRDVEKFIFKRTKGGGYQQKHPDGWAVDQVMVDFGKLGAGFDQWVTASKGTMRVAFKVNVIAKAANGFTPAYAADIVVATRESYSGKKRDAMIRTVLHEFGHVFGLGRKQRPKFTDAQGTTDGNDTNGKWYTNRNGGQGPHCNTGASLDSKNIYQRGTCIMYHQYSPTRKSFCDTCKELLKCNDLSTLALVNVNGEQWWTM